MDKMKSVAAISSSLAATIPAALARSRVSALRPCSEVSTLRPRSVSRFPTAAPIMPGAMTATRGFMGRSPIWRRRCAQSADIVAPWQGSLFLCPARRAIRVRCARAGTRARLGNGGHFGFAPPASIEPPPTREQETLVPDDLSDARNQVALANRMLANEGVFDAFGHVSVRHPTDPGRYLLPRSRSPSLIEPADVLEFTLDSESVT